MLSERLKNIMGEVEMLGEPGFILLLTLNMMVLV